MSKKVQEEQVKYSKVLSSMFCSTSIIVLSILCLLNEFSVDLYNMMTLLKTVVPGSFCFWFIGYAIGTILDRFNKKIVRQKLTTEKQAYEIPSMFAVNNFENASASMDDIFAVDQTQENNTEITANQENENNSGAIQ